MNKTIILAIFWLVAMFIILYCAWELEDIKFFWLMVSIFVLIGIEGLNE